MKSKMLAGAASLAFDNSRTLIASIFFFVMGISCGVFTELIMSPAGKADVLAYLQQYLYSDELFEYPNPFLSSAGSNIFLLALIGISGLSVFGFPAAFATLIYKGMIIGFSAGLLIESSTLSGIGSVMLSILPQNLILIPTFIIACTAAASYSFSALSAKRRPSKKNLKINSGSYFALNILLCIAILLGCLTEAVISPAGLL